MSITDETIEAYVAGELATDDVARVEAAVAADVMVAARVERARRMRAQARGAFEGMRETRAAAEDGEWSRSRGQPRAPPRSRASNDAASVHAAPRGAPARWRRVLIAAAACAAAVFASNWLQPDAPIRMRDDALVADGALARDLDSLLASAEGSDGTVVHGTFRDHDGRICRSFVRAEVGLAGLACRDGTRWRLDVVSRVDRRSEPSSEQSHMPVELSAAIELRQRGDAMTVEQERAARDAGWR